MSDLAFDCLFAALTKHVANNMINAKIDAAIQPDAEGPCLAQGRAFTDHQDGCKRLTDASFVEDPTVYAVPRAMTPAAIKDAAKRALDVAVKWTHAYGARPRAAKTKLMMVSTAKSLESRPMHLPRNVATARSVHY